MKKEYLKRGFGCFVFILLIIGASFEIYNMVNKNMTPVEETINEVQEEIPLQEAVGDNEVIAKTNSKKNTKKVVKKKTTKKVVKKKTIKKSTPKVTGTKAQYQAYAHDLVINQYGWSEYDFQCLVKLWNRESGWNPLAENRKSKARGIPQSLPASKMRSEGADYMTNGYTQIRWGLKYIKGRYGSPSRAWQHSQKKGWY